MCCTTTACELFHVKLRKTMWNRRYTKKPYRQRYSSSSKGLIRASRIPASIARVRKEWVTLYNDGGLCQTQCLEWDGESPCQTGVFEIGLVDQISLQSLFGDNVKVRRLVGEIWLRPWIREPDACFPTQVNQFITEAQNMMIHVRAGLIKQRLPGALIATGVPYDPLSGFDWTEAPWRREWRHTWLPSGLDVAKEWFGEGTLIGVCSDVTRTEYITPATASGDQPAFEVPEIETDCTEVTVGNESCRQGAAVFRAHSRPWWKMSLTSSRMHHMTESDSLSIFVNAAAITQRDTSCTQQCFEGSSVKPCRFTVFANVKAQIQYG